MALNSTVHPVLPVQNETTPSVVPDALLSMVLLSMFAANQSKKSLAKLKRKLIWQTLKTKFKSLLNKKDSISTRTLVYILLGVVIVAFIIIEPIAALAIALVGLIILLATGNI